jgi:hypothetical protein
MGAFTSILAAGAIGLQAYGQYKSGQDAQAAADYNAAIYQQQSQVIEVKKGITKQQYDRMIRKLQGASVTAIASSGFDMSGSFLEVMNDNLTQAQLDKQIEIYNLDVEKSFALSSADEARRAGARARSAANIGAITTILTGGNKWYQEYGGFGSTVKPTAKERTAQMSLIDRY